MLLLEIQQLVACDSLVWYGNTYTSSGIYKDTLQTTAGCDSIVTLNLTINNAVVGDTTNTTVCDSLVWNGSSYSSTGLYNDALQTISGCDSIITLNLTVSSSETATISYGSLGNIPLLITSWRYCHTAFSMDNPDEISFVWQRNYSKYGHLFH